MKWEAWVLVILFVYSALATIWRVGRRREVVTPAVAVIGVIEMAFYIWLVLRLNG